MRKIAKVAYIAGDGAEFPSEDECRKYDEERSLHMLFHLYGIEDATGTLEMSFMIWKDQCGAAESKPIRTGSRYIYAADDGTEYDDPYSCMVHENELSLKSLLAPYATDDLVYSICKWHHDYNQSLREFEQNKNKQFTYRDLTKPECPK